MLRTVVSVLSIVFAFQIFSEGGCWGEELDTAAHGAGDERVGAANAAPQGYRADALPVLPSPEVLLRGLMVRVHGIALGKISPVYLFWGSFDLAVTRFNGKPAPPRPGTDAIQAEAYSHECISAGFWPGNPVCRVEVRRA